MEIYCKDLNAEIRCRRKREKVVALVHRHLGLALVVEVMSVLGTETLELKTASGSIISGYNFEEIVAQITR